MKVFARAAALAALVLIAGCGGAETLGARPFAFLGGLPAVATSWMTPGAAHQNLLYVSDAGTNDVYVYSWPQTRFVGKLKGFSDPQGECVDKKGDVWIANLGTSQMIEYAHGGTKPIATLNNVGYAVNGCAVDPTTGNLAVTIMEKNGQSSGGSGGYVVIYKKARGTPKIYSDGSPHYPFFCGYDDRGNLYVDGAGDINPWDEFEFAKLPAGSSTFTDATLNENLNYSGGMQWHGRYIVVGDSRANVIYKFAIRGVYGYENGATPLDNASDVLQFWIEGHDVIGPNSGSASVMVWKYPARGAPVKTLYGFADPIGAVVSLRV